MTKRVLNAVLAGILAAGLICAPVYAQEEKRFVYGTMGYSEQMGDAGLNPHSNYAGWSAVRYGVGETLFRYSDDMEVEPWLALGYEYLDESTVRITLREGVRFSSGRTMDAEAVKECLEDLIAVHDRAPYDLKIDRLEAEGQLLTIHTSESCPALINYLGDPYAAIIDMEYGVQGEGGSANVSGTGPYIAVSVSPTQIELEANADYWGGAVNVDKVTVKSFSDGTALTAALQTGDVQGSYGLPYESYTLFEENPDYTVRSCATSRCFFGQFNFQSDHMQDPNVRRAIAMGIDKEGFCSVILNGRGLPAAAAFPDSFSFGNDAVSAVAYDPEGAAALLTASGWADTDGDGYLDKDGETLTVRWLTYPGRAELPWLAEYAQATLKEIGVKVDVNAAADHASYARNGEFDVYVSSLTTAPTGDPEYFFSATVTGSKNYGGYESGEAETLAETLHETFDTEERALLAVRLQQQLLDDDAYFFVSHLNMGIVTKSNVTGIAAHPCDYYEITAELDVE